MKRLFQDVFIFLTSKIKTAKNYPVTSIYKSSNLQFKQLQCFTFFFIAEEEGEGESHLLNLSSFFSAYVC